MSYHLTQSERDAFEFAERAVYFDTSGDFDAAVYYYESAAQALQEAEDGGSHFPNLSEKKTDYLTRAKTLLNQRNENLKLTENVSKNEEQKKIERAEFLLFQALEEDEARNFEEAVELYTTAVEICLDARKETKNSELLVKLSKLAEQALDRAERLKRDHLHPVVPKKLAQPTSPSLPFRVPPLGFGNLSLNDSPSNDNPKLSPALNRKHFVSGSASYTKEEIDVLKVSSDINGRIYVPFMTVDLKERFAYPVPFNDKDGSLALAPKQKSSFGGWVRPEDISSDPKLIETIDCFSIKQTVVSDCSFVASLAVSALYEKRFSKRIITSIIYPQNRQGDPVYNPCGKYMIKLHINGVFRKVIIDDKLPQAVGRRELLCSYSSKRDEFWVSLLEKAYMKVMGGYDFPGSNSNIDLHSLTGWIPERVALKDHPDPNNPFNPDAFFNMLADRHRKGDVLTTVATGEMSEADADRAGLVPTHAYAVLDVRNVMGQRLFLLKNPWSHLRWKGRYSEHDTTHWTPKLMEALKYDPKNAQMFDNGIFWIDYDSLRNFFCVAYLNWNPDLFKYTYCTHNVWNAGQGPIKDLYNIGDNPQYSLELQSGGCAVWVLLTRHITDRNDFADNQEYIAVLVYKNDGKKVYLPYEPAPFMDGVRINSPHYLCKMVIPQNGTTRYTLVISQYSKMTTIYYTLRAFATAPFSLNKIHNVFKYKQEIKNGEWTVSTAGGCTNYPQTHLNNPVYQVTLNSATDSNHLLIDLKGPKQYSVGFDVVTVTVNNASSPNYFKKKSSGSYKSGFTILELENVPSGTYNIIPATFLPGQCGPFFLTVQASCPIKISRIK